MAQLLIPDRPVAFGYKQVWLAVRDAEPQVVADTVGLIDTRASTWNEGIDRAYEQGNLALCRDFSTAQPWTK